MQNMHSASVHIMISVFFSFILFFIFSFVLSSLSVFFSLSSFSVSVSVWCGVVRCGACRVVWHAENPVCRLKTPPCVHSKRPRARQQHAHMLFNMCAWCRYTRGHRQFCLPRKAQRRVITCSREFHQKKQKNLTSFF